MTETYDMKKLKEKLLSFDNINMRLGLLYQWTKTGHINLREFKFLFAIVVEELYNEDLTSDEE